MVKQDSSFKENISKESVTEDELSAPAKPPRLIPRNSFAGNSSPTSLNPTPHSNLRQLAVIIRKPATTPPRRRSSLAAPLSQGRTVASKNPSRTPNARRPLQQTLGNRSNPTTPHAVRALQQRRATPGRDRRKSGRLQRETPRAILRNLSKALAPISQPVNLSPVAQYKGLDHAHNDELDDEQDLAQPRFSIAIDDGARDDDSFQEPPPRLSVPLEDGEQTGRSEEVARRIINEQALGRLSRGSFGSIRASDQFGNISELGYDDTSQSRTFETIATPRLGEDIDELGELGELSGLGGSTEDLRRVVLDISDHRRSLSNERQPARCLGADALSPFVFRIPHFERAKSGPNHVNPNGQLFEDDYLEQPFEDDDVERPDIPSADPGIQKALKATKCRNRLSKPLRKSRHGIPYPSLPPGVIKKIASTCMRALGVRKSSISKDTLKAIMEASDVYFEQFSEDLRVFSHHAGRKKIDGSDVIAIMKRQRQLSATSTPFFLAQKYLTGELLRDLRMPLHKIKLRQRRQRLEVTDEDDNSDN